MTKQVQFTSKQKRGCLIGCLAPFILIGIILIIAASMDASDRNKKKMLQKNRWTSPYLWKIELHTLSRV